LEAPAKPCYGERLMKPRKKFGPPRAHPPKASGAAPAAVDVDRLAWGGKGVGRLGGKVVFVSKAVPGDKVLVRLAKEKPRYAEGRIEAVLRPSPHRVDPKCKFFSHCGGCQWLAVSYERQLEEKEALVRSALRRHLAACPPEPIVPASSPRGYRHRLQLHVKATGRGVKIGFYQEESHQIINLDLCLLVDDAFNRVYGQIRGALQDEPAGACLEGLTLARSEAAQEYVLWMALSEGAGEAGVDRISGKVGALDLAGVVAAPARDAGAVRWSSGRPWVRFGLDEVPGGPFDLRADVRSFTQASYAMNRLLVRAAVEWLAPYRTERFLDLYSGVGNFTLPLAAACREVVAVEASPTAHQDAKENAARSGLGNIRHLPGEALPWITKLVASSERFDAVLLDPPRTGAREVLEPIVHLAPKRILYVSCNLPALDRDLEELGRRGYLPVRIQPWDLFPQTYGVETLVLLAKKG
jgi:23S rRNA (uracil1939-C5)-methyltransferase